jgi:hypothetical protein
MFPILAKKLILNNVKKHKSSIGLGLRESMKEDLRFFIRNLRKNKRKKSHKAGNSRKLKTTIISSVWTFFPAA